VQLEVSPVKRANHVPIEAATDPALNANRGAQVKVRGAPVKVAKYRQAPVQGEARSAVQGEARAAVQEKHERPCREKQRAAIHKKRTILRPSLYG
jgi:hypothetical protein